MLIVEIFKFKPYRNAQQRKQTLYLIPPLGPKHCCYISHFLFMFFRAHSRHNEHMCLYTLFFLCQVGSQTVVQFAFFLPLVWTFYCLSP